jgi:hypothetical protein
MARIDGKETFWRCFLSLEAESGQGSALFKLSGPSAQNGKTTEKQAKTAF